jgi:hypothetical protein
MLYAENGNRTHLYDENGNRTDLTDVPDVIHDWGTRFMYWRFVRSDDGDDANKDNHKFGVNHPGSFVKQ